MIRWRDEIRLCAQKVGLRKRRAAFAVVSVALGIVVVVTARSLMSGVRNVALKTLWSEEIDPDVIRVFAGNNPYEMGWSDPERERKAQKRFQFLTEALFEKVRAWPEIEAADRPVEVPTLSIDAFARQPRPVTALQGLPEPLLSRYVADPSILRQCSNAIPLVVGERHVRLRYDEKKKKTEIVPPDRAKSWIGRDVTILLGDNYAQVSQFRYHHDKREFVRITDDELAAQRENVRRAGEANYDPVLFQMTLPLKGRIVGLCPGNRAFIPTDPARLCEKWIQQRNQLAGRHPPPDTEPPAYESGGRRTPRTGEYTEGLVLVRRGADVERVACRIEALGYSVTTRARTFENQARAFDSGIRIVKRIVYALGAVILGIAGALIWSTASKTVSDSRTDIGLFRALGATKRDVRRLFLGESMLLGALGTMAGIFLGWTLAIGVSHWVVSLARREVVDPEDALLVPHSIFSFDLPFCLALLAGAALMSLLAGWIPATRAANVDPVQALKRE